MIAMYLLLTVADALVDGTDALHGVAHDEAHGVALGCGGLQLGGADLLLRALLDELVAVEEQCLQLTHILVGCLVDDGLVDMPHGVFGYHQRVGLVVLALAHAHAALDLQRPLAPDVKTLGVDVVAQAAVVAAGRLTAEQHVLQPDALDQVPCPDEHAAVAHGAVLVHLVVQLDNSQLAVSHVDCGCVDFFLRNVDADYNFLHVFAFNSYRKRLTEASCELLLL